MTDHPSPYDPGSTPLRIGVGAAVHDLVKEWRNRATILERQVKDFEAEAFKMCDERNKAEDVVRNNAAQRDAIARQQEEAVISIAAEPASRYDQIMRTLLPIVALFLLAGCAADSSREIDAALVQ